MLDNVLDQRRMRVAIEESHRRAMEFGISSSERNPNQVALTPAQLVERQRANSEFLGAVRLKITEFYDLLSPNDFMLGVVDAEGFILHMAGSDDILAKFAERNCTPGYRWTERDVGTTAISLCLKLKIPLQINDKEHYCRRAHGFTSSAAPVFGPDDGLLGVLVVSGSSTLVHPHTLFMIASAAKSIEKELRVLRQNRELDLNVGFLDNVIEAASTGLLVLDADMRIWRINKKGKRIFGARDLEGKPVSVLGNLEIDVESVRNAPDSWNNVERTLRIGRRNVHLLVTAQLVFSRENDFLGMVLGFEEQETIRKLAGNLAGSRPYFTFDSLIGSSLPFRKILSLAHKASRNDSTVLLQGETGTGKELFAQAIHNASKRHRGPFVPINCGAIPHELLESELFGYVDGAFTGAAKGGRPGKFEFASGGTLLLDEIGDMPHDMQVKLLRVLQTGEVFRIGSRKPILVDTRIIACTHVNLAKAVSEKRFRQDLYYRLNVFPLVIPPLRERGREDILALISHFLQRNSTNPPILSPEAVNACVDHTWPGNVRELENTIQRALHLCEGDKIMESCLGLQQQRTPSVVRPGTLEDMERDMIAATLDSTGANMAESARILGVSRATLYRKVKRFELV